MTCILSTHRRHVCAGPVRPGPHDVPLCTVARMEILEEDLDRFDRRYGVDLRLIGAGLAEQREGRRSA